MLKLFNAGVVLAANGLIACSEAPPPATAAASVQHPVPAAAGTLGAGFRFSTYGPDYDPGAEYWAYVGEQMAARFPEAVPEAIWIVGRLHDEGTLLSFPGESEDALIRFAEEDGNAEALDLFDRRGFRVWLQVEPGHDHDGQQDEGGRWGSVNHGGLPGPRSNQSPR